MNRWILTGSIFGFLAVSFGAFGAHALAPYLSDAAKGAYETASKYQFYHAIVLLFLGLVEIQQRRRLTLTGYSWSIGITLFSGSLYAIALTEIRSLGWITPMGGLALLIGWLSLAWHTLRSQS